MIISLFAGRWTGPIRIFLVFVQFFQCLFQQHARLAISIFTILTMIDDAMCRDYTIEFLNNFPNVCYSLLGTLSRGWSGFNWDPLGMRKRCIKCVSVFTQNAKQNVKIQVNWAFSRFEMASNLLKRLRWWWWWYWYWKSLQCTKFKTACFINTSTNRFLSWSVYL